MDYPIVYVDGSFDRKRELYSYGAVFLMPSGEVIELNGVGDDKEAAAEWNVAGELLGAMTAVKYACDNGYTKLLIKYDYEGIASWATGKWKAKKFCSNQYLAFLKKYSGRMTIEFEKVLAHSGVTYNERADKLAKEALKGS